MKFKIRPIFLSVLYKAQLAIFFAVIPLVDKVSLGNDTATHKLIQPAKSFHAKVCYCFPGIRATNYSAERDY